MEHRALVIIFQRICIELPDLQDLVMKSDDKLRELCCDKRFDGISYDKKSLRYISRITMVNSLLRSIEHGLDMGLWELIKLLFNKKTNKDGRRLTKQLFTLFESQFGYYFDMWVVYF